MVLYCVVCWFAVCLFRLVFFIGVGVWLLRVICCVLVVGSCVLFCCVLFVLYRVCVCC